VPIIMRVREDNLLDILSVDIARNQLRTVP